MMVIVIQSPSTCGPSGETRTPSIQLPKAFYAKMKEECEELLEKMIAEVRERIKEEKKGRL